ncbi:MAG TPA: cysteine synthase family protein [Ilumatobacteraceae bacterium]|nr:cysteine synthase family protein [Ilumatobacteraceae bacterium]
MSNAPRRDVAPPRLASSILEAIGNTPLVELHRVVAAEGVDGRILAKLEHLQPGLSKKSRIALEMVLDARAAGDLVDGQTVVELTSGNTGTGLAIVCSALGHPFVAVMSRGNTIERARMMAALGAEIVLVDQAPGSVHGEVSGADLDLVEAVAREIVTSRRAFRADQFQLPASAAAHERWTAEELWQQSGGRIDAFVDFVGSGGSYGGIVRGLQHHDPAVRGYVIEPAGAAVLAGGRTDRPGHPIQGGGYSRADLALLDGAPVHGYLEVDGDEARAAARLLARTEGIFGGFSAGANLAGALALLRGPERGNTVVMLVCDSGLKYLSTDLYPFDLEE